MTNRKNTQRALVASALAVLLCVSMLVGSTFAWFTDNATTNVNAIVSGKLDIDLVDAEGKSLDKQTMNFVDKDGKELTTILWEPGAKFKLEPISLVNKGNLYAKCKVFITAVNGNTTGNGYNLADVIDVIVADKTVGTLSQVIAKGDAIDAEFELAPNATADYGTVELMMKTTAGNEYQGLSLNNIAITVLATQAVEEFDSYENTYDEGATYATVVNNVEELTDAINSGKEVALASDITLDVPYINMVFGDADTDVINIDGNGHTITFDNGREEVWIDTANPDAVLNISNATIARSNPTVGNYLTFLTFECNTNLTNVTAAESINLWGVGKTYNLNNVKIVDERTSAAHYAMFIMSGNTVTIDGCVFDNDQAGNRAIKISDANASEDASKAVTNLTVKNTTFASNMKAAILVGTKYGANVTLENVDITKVAADSTNAVWVEDKYAAYTDTIVVTGGTKAIEK